MKASRVLLAVLFFLVVIETGLRLQINANLGSFYPKEIECLISYYPKLIDLQSYHYGEEEANMLVLGGSVLYDDTLVVEQDKELVNTFFCGINDLQSGSYNVLNLAAPGHNSLDSKIKYASLSKYKFDYVFLYHGINDIRTNNWPHEAFDTVYRHIEFYDDLAVVKRHPEAKFYATPFAFDWLFHSMRKKRRSYLPKEIFQGLLKGEPESFLQYGDSIKSAEVFRKNIENIIHLAREKEEQVILATYAWYLPENYSYEGFKAKQLDYDQQVYPTELYGLPANVKKGLIAHNEVIRELAIKHPEVILIDLEQAIPESGEYFDDVCHLNENGCEILESMIERAIDDLED